MSRGRHYEVGDGGLCLSCEVAEPGSWLSSAQPNGGLGFRVRKIFLACQFFFNRVQGGQKPFFQEGLLDSGVSDSRDRTSSFRFNANLLKPCVHLNPQRRSVMLSA